MDNVNLVGETGPPGPIGPIGPIGPRRANAYTTITSAFTVPPVGFTTTATVVDASWLVPGQVVYVAGAEGAGIAGDLEIVSVAGNTLTLMNLPSTAGAVGGGDTYKATYDKNNKGIVDAAETVPWSGVTNPPGGLLPTGTVLSFAGAVAPANFLLCDGKAYPTVSYPALFAVIGYIYGGSGANFNVPDLRGRTPLGAGAGAGLTNRALAATGGEETHTLTLTETPIHSHTISVSDPGHANVVPVHGHGFNDPGHNHPDPGHNHGFNDPGHNTLIQAHSHGLADPGVLKVSCTLS